MKKQYIKIIFLVVACALVLSCTKNAEEAPGSTATITAEDQELTGIITTNALTPLSEPATESEAVVLLGEALFADNALSGNRNISCLSCHSTTQGTGDGMPFSIGTGATGIGSQRRQLNGISTATTRNTPAIYNTGRTGLTRAFWDGRISINNRVIASSIPEISGNNPIRADISNIFTNVFDLQPLFPLLSSVEMLGTNNELSAHPSNIDIWQAILTDRLLTNPTYVTLFNNAFPTTATANLNPGHMGRAMGAFMKIRFKANNTPFDNYLNGELNALSTAQKRGMILFYNKGQCVRCHSGNNFSDQNFHSVAAPQIGFAPFADDTGRAGTTGLAADNYKFKTPSLRNISLTGPYMHNGSLETLEAVVSHYNSVSNSLSNYSIPSSYQGFYQTQIIYDNNATRNQARINQIDIGQIRNGLRLTDQEQAEIVDFLRNALRDPAFE